jgi:hypothetical protein
MSPVFFSDGNNLRYALYNTCPVRNTCYGGDYRKYYAHVKAYFQRWTILSLSLSLSLCCYKLRLVIYLFCRLRSLYSQLDFLTALPDGQDF